MIQNSSLSGKTNKVNDYKRYLRDYITNTIQPNVFITIQPAFERKTTDAQQFTEEIKFILRLTEKNLLGKRWSKHHYPFVVCLENDHGKSTWHAHILGKFTNPFTGQPEPQGDIEQALEKANHSYRCKYGCKQDINTKVCMLDNATSVRKATSYCTKETWCQFLYDSEPVRSEKSSALFGLGINTSQSLDAEIKQKLLAGTNA